MKFTLRQLADAVHEARKKLGDDVEVLVTIDGTIGTPHAAGCAFYLESHHVLTGQAQEEYLPEDMRDFSHPIFTIACTD